MHVLLKTASAGNRTRAARMAGEHSTTEPPMRWELDARPVSQHLGIYILTKIISGLPGFNPEYEMDAQLDQSNLWFDTR